MHVCTCSGSMLVASLPAHTLERCGAASCKWAMHGRRKVHSDGEDASPLDPTVQAAHTTPDSNNQEPSLCPSECTQNTARTIFHYGRYNVIILYCGTYIVHNEGSLQNQGHICGHVFTSLFLVPRVIGYTCQ